MYFEFYLGCPQGGHQLLHCQDHYILLQKQQEVVPIRLRLFVCVLQNGGNEGGVD